MEVEDLHMSRITEKTNHIVMDKAILTIIRIVIITKIVTKYLLEVNQINRQLHKSKIKSNRSNLCLIRSEKISKIENHEMQQLL